jgi:hypothetical protein
MVVDIGAIIDEHMFSAINDKSGPDIQPSRVLPVRLYAAVTLGFLHVSSNRAVTLTGTIRWATSWEQAGDERVLLPE